MDELTVPIFLIGLIMGASLSIKTMRPATPPPLKKPHWVKFPTLYSGLYGSLILHLCLAIADGGETLAWIFVTLPILAIPISGVSFSTRLWFSIFTGKAIRGALRSALVLLATSSVLSKLYFSSGNDQEAEDGRLFLANAILVSASWLLSALSVAIRKRTTEPNTN